MNCTRGNRRTVALLACIGLLLPGSGALAEGEEPDVTVAQAEPGQQAPETSATPESEREGIEEIVVTSRKREETLQEVPLAVTAFTEIDLKDQQIRRLDDVMKTTPSLMMDNAVGGTSGSARIYMRGVGNGNAGLRDENGIGIYIDGVYQPRATQQILAVSDIRSIEVLRGPQGTLFGKNTIGGAINVTTAKPGTDFAGYGEVRVGNESQIDTRFSVDVPVTETFRTRWSFATRTSDGWTKSVLSHNDFSDDRLLAARGSFLWDATDNLELLLTLDGAQQDRATRATKCSMQPGALELIDKIRSDAPSSERRGTPLGAQLSPTTRIIRRDTLDLDALGLDLPAAPPGVTPGSFEHACIADEHFTSKFRTREANLGVLGVDTGQYEDVKTYGSTLTATWLLGDAWTLKSTTGWHGFHSSNRNATDGTVFAILGDMPGEDDKGDHNTYSQELLLTGSALDARLHVTAGLYWFSEENTSKSPALTSPYLELIQDDPNTTFGDGNRCFIANGLCELGSFFLSEVLEFPNIPEGVAASDERSYARFLRDDVLPPSVTRFWTANKNYAAFTELTYDFTDQLSLSVGVRYSHERRRIRINTFRSNSENVFSDINWTVQRDAEIEAILREALDPEDVPLMEGFRVDRLGNFEPCLVTTSEACAGQFSAVPREKSSRWSAWTPSFNLRYQITDDINAYVRWARGWKSGLLDARPVPLRDAQGRAIEVPGDEGLPNADFQDVTQEVPVEPEFVASWEVGVKSDWFDNRLQLNLAYFRNLWEDAQLTIVTTDINGDVTTIDENAGKALIHGLELEARARPLAGLTLSSSLSVTSARYQEFESCGFVVLRDQDNLVIEECSGFEVPPSSEIPSGPLSNNNLPGTPKYQYSFAASYVFPIGDLGDLRTRLQWAAETERSADILDPHFTRSPKHGTLDGLMTLELADGRTQLSLWGTNLLDREYFTNAINVASVASLRGMAPPRRYGLEVRREFGY